MSLFNNDQYCVLASGECLAGFTPEQVAASLVQQWQLSESECEAWLSQRQVFYRQGLSQQDAQILQRTLTDTGLKAQVISQQQVDVPPEPANQDGLKAQRFLSLATTLLIIGYVVDNTLLGAFLPGMENLDFGILPYLASVLVMCKGLYHFVKLKGYSGYLALLGFAGLLGLALALFLPSRENPVQRKLLQSSTLFALFCFIFGGVGLYSQVGNYLHQSEYVEISRHLQDGRNEYPSTQQDLSLTLYEQEWRQLNQFIDEGLSYIADEDLRPNYQASMISAIGEEVDRFFIWINYQQYLAAHQSTQQASFALPDKQIAQWKQQVFDKLWAFRSGYQVGDQVLTSLNKYLGQGIVRYEDAESANAVGHYIGKLYQALQMARLTYISKNMKVGEEEPFWPVDLTKLPVSAALPSYVTSKADKDKVTFTFVDGPLAGKPPVVIAVMSQYTPATKWRRASTRYTFRQISPEFPNHLLISFGLRTLDKQISNQFEKSMSRN
ncbi:hypothetical protein [Motilimonas sp. E26]|uniref:hypothetical protein n=1 Tax=Motilimonas sp. E26 TaxID=2865674 RepID=UPI001E577731|nr:hypothetical protein [Motilimonas sp. E26]MCE0555859.1 hypothetical protein [Motilimonas sp. E26]